MQATPQIRAASTADVSAINAIYNHYVLHSSCTYQTEPEADQSRLHWLTQREPAYPVTVAEIGGVVVGWGALSRFHPRQAYARTVENAVYVDHRHQRRGIGKLLLVDLIERARVLEHHTIIALVSGDQTASLALHEALGFTKVGVLKEAGFKLQQWLDVVYLQRML
jgi:L-amino acid N-acyltransferase